MAFLKWARAEGYDVQPRILELKRPRVPVPEPTVYHAAQLRDILQACDPDRPEEGLAVRMAFVGSGGCRWIQKLSAALKGDGQADGLPDLMLELGQAHTSRSGRFRSDADQKAVRSATLIPITPKLASAIKRYEGRYRKDVEYPNLLINRLAKPYKRFGVDAMIDRLQRRVGFRVHAHGFRHTFATVATQLGWNLEHLRAAMGHADYTVLQRYVRLATERDLREPQGMAGVRGREPGLGHGAVIGPERFRGGRRPGARSEPRDDGLTCDVHNGSLERRREFRPPSPQDPRGRVAP